MSDRAEHHARESDADQPDPSCDVSAGDSVALPPRAGRPGDCSGGQRDPGQRRAVAVLLHHRQRDQRLDTEECAREQSAHRHRAGHRAARGAEPRGEDVGERPLRHQWSQRPDQHGDRGDDDRNQQRHGRRLLPDALQHGDRCGDCDRVGQDAAFGEVLLRLVQRPQDRQQQDAADDRRRHQTEKHPAPAGVLRENTRDTAGRRARAAPTLSSDAAKTLGCSSSGKTWPMTT